MTKRGFFKGDLKPGEFDTAEERFGSAYKANIRKGRLYIELSHGTGSSTELIRAAIICETIYKCLDSIPDEKLFEVLNEIHYYYFNGDLDKRELESVYETLKESMQGLKEIHQVSNKAIMGMMEKKG